MTEILTYLFGPDPRWAVAGLQLVVGALLLLAGLMDLHSSRVPLAALVPLLLLASVRTAVAGNWVGLVTLAWMTFDPEFVRERPTLQAAIEAVLVTAAGWLGIAGGQAEVALTVVVWLLVFHFYRLNWMGGGDGLVMASLLALAPTPTTLLWIAGGWLAAGALWAVARYRKSALVALASAPRGAVDRATLLQHGVPVTWGFALSWIAHLVEYWA
jgi:Flp pilus assembly protein protease CpaA